MKGRGGARVGKGKGARGRKEKKGGRGWKRGGEERERLRVTGHTNPSLLPAPLQGP